MAGDWIKMSTGLRRHPKVVRMASALKADRLRIVGGLHAVWSVFDEHSPDGLLPGYTQAVMDEEIGWKGFSAALSSVGWLEETDEGLAVPGYEGHNGSTAKRRAMETKRKQDDRNLSATEPHKKRTESGQMSASDADKLRTREEKRREEKKEIQQPDGVAESVWSDFLKLRKAKRAPLTDTALDGIRAEAGKAGMDLGTALAMCCKRGWQGFEAAWVQGKSSTGDDWTRTAQ